MFGWFKKKSPPPNLPDLSRVDSLAIAEELFRQGLLEKMLLRPLELGGEDHPLNTLYVPVGVASIKSDFDNNVIVPLAAEGKITQYQAMPEYQGTSFIPISVTIVASDPGRITTTINIWGEALTRGQNA